MKEFGEFLAKAEAKWFMAEDNGVEVARFGPTTKAWHLHFVKKGDFWYLNRTIGGD